MSCILKSVPSEWDQNYFFLIKRSQIRRHRHYFDSWNEHLERNSKKDKMNDSWWRYWNIARDLQTGCGQKCIVSCDADDICLGRATHAILCARALVQQVRWSRQWVNGKGRPRRGYLKRVRQVLLMSAHRLDGHCCGAVIDSQNTLVSEKIMVVMRRTDGLNKKRNLPECLVHRWKIG